MRAQGIMRIGFVMALGMAAATIGCGDDTSNNNKDAAQDVKDAGGSGGKTDAGGSGGTAGKVDGGGSGGAAGKVDGGSEAGTDGGSAAQVLFDFTSNATGWSLNTGDARTGNLGLLEAGTLGTVEWVSTGGGALEVFAPFTDTAQWTPASYVYSTPVAGVTGKKLTITYKIGQLLPASLQWVAALNVMTNQIVGTAWSSAGSEWCSIPANTNWNTCVVDLTGANLKQIMIYLQTGDPMADAGVPSGDVTVLIDNITLE